MIPLIDFVALTDPELLPTEAVCPRCHLAKHAAAFRAVIVGGDYRHTWAVCRDCAGGGA